RNVRLVAVLLEEHPLQRLGTGEAVFRNVPAAFRQVPEDRVGLRQASPAFELERRNAAIGVPGQEFGGARGALQDIQLLPAVRTVEEAQQQADLVAIAGIQVVVEGG